MKCVECGNETDSLLVMASCCPKCGAVPSEEKPEPSTWPFPFKGDDEDPDRHRRVEVHMCIAGALALGRKQDCKFCKVFEHPLFNRSCPCSYITPCDPQCTCVAPASSHGCSRCCSYGSLEQRTAAANRLAGLVVRSMVWCAKHQGMPVTVMATLPVCVGTFCPICEQEAEKANAERS